MSETCPEIERSVAEERILTTRLPEGYGLESPRVCLLQIRKVETSTDETEEKRKALEEALYWDYEDYNADELGARPDGTDPKADVLVCGIGGCTLRIFQAKDGSPIQTGVCKAAGYCLRDRFKAVGSGPTVEEGQALYKDIIDTCDGWLGGNYCPRLNCDLSAGVSEDCVPGTHGTCEVKDLVKLEGFDSK